MKKFLIILLAVTALTGCSLKNEPPVYNEQEFSDGIQRKTFNAETYSDSTLPTITNKILQSEPETYTTTIQNFMTENTTLADTTDFIITTPAPDVPETTSETIATITTTILSINTTTITNAETLPDDPQPDPLGAGAFVYDEAGAVQFAEESQDNDEQILMSAGKALFESACQTEWNFTVGCPYSIDEKNSINAGAYGWTYYRITDTNIHSIADIERDYYNVFSDRYPHEDLKMLYVESNGNVYAMNGKREMNAYYSMSRITGIISRTSDEIVFNVENQFEGNDLEPDKPYSENDTFSVVISPDGKWKAGQFRLPY
ncbi:MAG: membrane lipoprotein lipid attachment site-containing protein [Ruminococcus sp.]|nr:membrane lipoprotein lipid attachment site-containing protein [Ruminococcus sp.]